MNEMFEKIKNKIKMKSAKVVDISDDQTSAYLAQFNCTTCGKRCPLSEIRCGGGVEQRNAKVSELENQMS